MGKDRLAELQEKSKHVKQSDVEMEEMKPLKKQDKKLSDSQENFFDTLNTINTSIDKVQENVEEVKKLQRKILNAVHRNDTDHTKLNDLNAANFKLAQNIRKAIADEQDKVEQRLNPKKTLSPIKTKVTPRQKTDLRVRKTQLDGQSTRMFNIWNEYNQSQLQFREESKKMFVRQCKIMGNTSLSNEEIETMIDEGKNVFATSILDQERMARQQLLDLQERHGEFMKLEKQIEELRDMFVEIAALVENQGEMVDRIQTHVQHAEIDVEQGKGHLSKAKDYMEKARKKKIILATIIIVVVLILLIVILAEFGAFSSSSSNNSEPAYTYPTTTLSTTTSTSTTTLSSISFNDPKVDGKTEPPLEVPETKP